MLHLSKRTVLISIILSLHFPPAFAENDEAAVHFKQGHRFYLDAKSEQAVIEFRNALQLEPQLSDAYYYLSSIYFKQYKYKEAITECNNALQIKPDDVKSLIILGLAQQQLNLLESAIETFKKAANVNTQSAAAHSALGLAYCAQSNFEKAKEEYLALKKIDQELAADLLQQINAPRQPPR